MSTTANSSMAVIEIYLKPLGDGFNSRKFREVPSDIGEDTSNYRECMIQKSDRDFAIVLKFPDEIFMPDEAILLVEISMTDLSSSGTSGTMRFWLSHRQIHRGQYVRAELRRRQRHNSVKLTTKGFKNVVYAMTTPFDGVEPKSGTITVVLTPGLISRSDGWIGRHSRRGPRYCSEYNYTSARALGGESGKVQTTVFRPLAKAAFDNAVGKCLHNVPAALSPSLPGFTEDTEYETDRLASDQRFEELCVNWEKEQAELKITASADQIANLSPPTNAPEATDAPSEPSRTGNLLRAHIAPLQEDTSEPTKPGSNLSTPIRANKVARQTRTRKPVICNCPLKHDVSPKRAPSSKGTNINKALGSVVAPQKTAKAKQTLENEKTPELQPSATSKETVAVACAQCTQLKRAPRGKKIAFRKDRGRFMYVPQNAPGDDEVEYTAQGGPSQQIDQDDEEPLPQLDHTGTKTVENSEVVHGTSGTTTHDDHVMQQEATGEPQTTLETVENERDLASAVPQTPETTVIDAARMPPIVNQGPQTTVEAPTIEQAVAQEDNETSSTMIAPEHRTSPQKADNATGIVEKASSTEATSKPRDEIALSDAMSGMMSAQDTMVSNPSPTMQLPTSTESKKRSATPAVEERPTKQQRIDVDLTNDDDEDLILVKTETMDIDNKDTTKRATGTEEQHELEARLRKVVMQRKELKLQYEETELRQKLESLKQHGGSLTHDKKAAVKVEIEID